MQSKLLEKVHHVPRKINQEHPLMRFIPVKLWDFTSFKDKSFFKKKKSFENPSKKTKSIIEKINSNFLTAKVIFKQKSQSVMNMQ